MELIHQTASVTLMYADWQGKRFMAMYGVNNCADYVFSAKIINKAEFIYIFLPVFLMKCLFNFEIVSIT